MWQIVYALHSGAAYWATEYKGRQPARVRWLTPTSVKPSYVDGRLHSFIRKAGASSYEWQFDEMTTRATSKQYGDLGWVWALGLQEIGPGIALDGVVELPNNVLKMSDALMDELLGRGAVLAHWVTADYNPPQPEKDALREKIRRTLFRGVKSPASVEVFGKGLDIKSVGTKPSDLELESTNRGNEEQISVAMETPRPLVTGEAANRSVLDRLTQMWILYTVAPIVDRVLYAFNHHTLKPNGYYVKAHPETLTTLQEEEVQRANAVAVLVSAGETLGNAYAILGYDLPDDMEPRPTATAVTVQPATIGNLPPTDDGEEREPSDGGDEGTKSAAYQSEAARFRRWYKKRGARADIDAFNSDILGRAAKVAIIEDDEGEPYESPAIKAYYDTLDMVVKAAAQPQAQPLTISPVINIHEREVTVEPTPVTIKAEAPGIYVTAPEQAEPIVDDRT
jgi:hypothetical protein